MPDNAEVAALRFILTSTSWADVRELVVARPELGTDASRQRMLAAIDLPDEAKGTFGPVLEFAARIPSLAIAMGVEPFFARIENLEAQLRQLAGIEDPAARRVALSEERELFDPLAVSVIKFLQWRLYQAEDPQTSERVDDLLQSLRVVRAALWISDIAAKDPLCQADGGAFNLYEGAFAYASSPGLERFIPQLRVGLARELLALRSGDRDENVLRAIVLLSDVVTEDAEVDALARCELGRAHLEARFGSATQHVDEAIDALNASLALTPVTNERGRARALGLLALAYPRWSGAESLAHGFALGSQKRVASDELLTKLGANATWLPYSLRRSALHLEDLDVIAANAFNAAKLLALRADHECALTLFPEGAPLRAEWLAGLAALLGAMTFGTPTHDVREASAAFQAAAQAAEGDARLLRTILQRYGAMCHGRRMWRASFQAHRHALELSDRLLETAGTPESRASIVEADRGLALQASYAAARAGDLGQAIEAAERGRARLRRDDLAVAELVRSGPPAACDEARAAHGRVSALEAELLATDRGTALHSMLEAFGNFADYAGADDRLAGLRLTKYDRAAELSARRARVALSQRLRNARDELRSVLTQWGAGDALSADDIGDVVRRSGRPLVYLLPTTWGTQLVAVFPDGGLDALELPQLGSDGLARLLHGEDGPGYVAAAMQKDRASLERELERCSAVLGPRLWEPVREWLAGRSDELTVVGLGSLGQLPIHVAALEAGLLVSVVPSARVLRSAVSARDATTARAPAVFAVGDPHAFALPSLAFADVEAANLCTLVAEARLVSGSNAVRGEVLRGIAACTHMHFAGHATFRPSDAFASRLHLHGDEPLTVRDIVELPTASSSMRLVVLSACQTGNAEFRRVPDETLGFQASFLVAGAGAVVTAAWKIDDVASALLMDRFYRGLYVHKAEPLRALTAAQVWLRTTPAPGLLEIVQAMRERIPTTSAEAHAGLRMLARQLRNAGDAIPFGNREHWGAFVYAGT